MQFTISYHQKSLGSVEIVPSGFTLTVSNKNHRTILQKLFSSYFENGIKGGVENDDLRTKPLFPNDPRFVHELAIRLYTLEYILS